MTSEILITADIRELHLAATRLFVEAARKSVGQKGSFTVALSGGSTPRGFYALLADDASLRKTVPWEHIRFFWSDERCVPPDHRDSNYRMAWEVMLSKVPVTPSKVYRIRGEDRDPSATASSYEQTLGEIFRSSPGNVPSLDLILLGIGADGHTASLFPGSEALTERDRLVVAAWIGRLKAFRITFTLPLINAARQVIFLVSGEDKAEALRRVVEGPTGGDPLPAALVRPVHGRLTWIVDKKAARLLRGAAVP